MEKNQYIWLFDSMGGIPLDKFLREDPFEEILAILKSYNDGMHLRDLRYDFES